MENNRREKISNDKNLSFNITLDSKQINEQGGINKNKNKNLSLNNTSYNTIHTDKTKDYSKIENNNMLKEQNNMNYYNPFSEKNVFENPIINMKNNQRNYDDKLPFITLTSSFSCKMNKEKDSNNIFSSNNELDTLEKKIKNDKRYSCNIAKLKRELNANKETIMENKGKRLNIYEEEKEKEESLKNESLLNYNNNKDSINGIKNSNSSNDEDNLENSCQIIDIDKSSEYTLQTGTNIDYLIKKKSNWSPILIGILFGCGAIFYLVYKKIKVKEIIEKLSLIFKIFPEFGNYIASNVLSGMQDFMVMYDDINRLLAGIFIFIIFWFLLKLIMKKIICKKA